jgi:hypothetical protein
MIYYNYNICFFCSQLSYVNHVCYQQSLVPTPTLISQLALLLKVHSSLL